MISKKKLDKKVPVVLFGKEFWNSVVDFKALVKYGVISKSDLNLFRIIDDVDEAFDYITRSLKRHYFFRKK